MSFGIEISFEGSYRVVEYRWTSKPHDGQVDEFVDDELMFHYKNIVKFIIKSLRDSDQTAMSSGNMTIRKIYSL